MIYTGKHCFTKIRKIFFVVTFALVAAAAFSQIKADPTGWKKNDFTKEWKEYVWEFDASKFSVGSNTISFNFTSGGHKLCLKDVTIIADGKIVLTDKTEKSAGNNPKSASYTFSLTSAPRTITLKGKARTDGGTNSNGTITIKPTEFGWKRGEFTTDWKEYTWKFPVDNFTKGTNTISFTYTDGYHKLCLKDVKITADGKTVFTDSTEKSAGGSPRSAVYKFTLTSAPRTIALTAQAKTAGGTDSVGTILLNGVVNIPEGTKEIKGSAYEGSGARKVTIPSSVSKIGGQAFKGCEYLTEIEIPSNVTEFGTGIFDDCKNLTAIKVDKYSEAHACFSVDKRLAFTNNKPKQTKEQWFATSKNNIFEDGILYIGNGVTKIQDGQYKDNKDITEIRFLDTTTKMAGIGTSAFRNCTGLKKVVIPGNVKNVADWAFSGCSNLEEVIIEEGVENIVDYAFNRCPKLLSVTLPKSIKSIGGDDIMGNKGKRIYHCWLGSKACSAVIKRYCRLDVIGIDEENIDNIDLKQISIVNTTIKDGLFRNLPFERIDIADNLTEIGKNAFNDNTVIRAKRNTATDKCLRANGYYLCGALCDVNIYTKDKSKEIKEDFTRVFSDYDPYWKWSTYKVNTYQPLLLEEVDDKLVITSVMLDPCKNVTVTDKNGKALIRNKTIQPFTRMELCDFDFLTDSVDNYTLTVNDDLYKKLVAGQVKWDISFDFAVRRTTTPDSVAAETFRPVYAREFIAGMYNVAYIIGSEEYERRCYEAVDKKLLVTDEALTVPLTREQMENLLKKTKKWSFVLGRDNIAGTGGGGVLTMDTDFILAFSKGAPSAFWHEFSHCMGWAHENGNMCFEGRPEPYNVDWPSIGSYLYQEEYKKGNTPYTYDKYYLNSFFFSQPDIFPPDVEPDVVKDDTLYIADGMPKTGSFKKRTDFTKVVIPSSVSLISGSAFYDTRLDEITIPSSVGKIDGSAFFGCLSLKKIDIPDTVKSIGSSAFQNCTSLTSVKIGSGMRQISKEMFKDSALTEVTIPKNIKYIANNAFQNCRNLTKVVLEDGVRKIGDNAFDGTALTEIVIPPSVTMIGKNITSKNVIWNVKEGTYAYTFAQENGFPIGTLSDKGDSILAESIDAKDAPNGTWQNGIFSKTDERRKWDFSGYINGSGTYTVTFKYATGSDILRLTDTIFTADGKTIAYFAEQRSVGKSYPETVYNITVPAGTKKLEMYALARAGNSNITGTIIVSNMNTTKLVILAGTETIKDSAYFGSKFEEVELPTGLKKIGSLAFQDSTELKSITIPDTVTEIGSSAFQNCPALTSAKIGSGLIKVSYRLFKNTALKEVIIPGSIMTIGEEAFRDCEFLTKADISYGVTKIDKNAFNNCHELKTITIPNSVTVIGDGAFQSCTSLTSVKLGTGLQNLNKNLFNGSGLTSIIIPGTIETIGEGAFSSCANLKNVTIQYGVKEIGRSAFASSALTSLNIPESVTNIGVRAFDNAAITKVTLPSSLVELSTCAFIDSALTEVTIPGTLKKIDVKCFQGCENLTKVIIKDGVEEICEKAFWNTGIKEIKIPSSVKTIGLKILPEDAEWDVEVGSYAYQFALENNCKIKATDAVLKDKTARLLADRSIESAPSDKWQKNTFTSNDVRRKWDFSSFLKGGGTYTITFKYTNGAHKLSLTDSFIIADGRTIAYHPETLSAGASPNKFVFTVEVPAGTKKLELYALAKGGGGSDSNGTITVEKK